MMSRFSTTTRAKVAGLTAGVMFQGGTLCAAPVLGNLLQPAQDLSAAVSYNQWQASSFRLSAAAGAWRVRSVTVRIAQRTPNDLFNFRIVGEEALRPANSAVRVTFNTPAISGTATQTITFTAKESPAPVLQPGQTFWLIGAVDGLDNEHVPATGLTYWSYAQNSLMDPAPGFGWSFGPATASAGTGGSSWAPETTTPYTFSIDAVPENTAMTIARWRELHPGGPVDNLSWLNADPDQNGLNGLLDFAFDRNPANLPTPVTDGTGRFGLEYMRWINAPEISLQLETSPDLLSWQPATSVETTVVSTALFSQRVRALLPATQNHQYTRLRLRRL